MGHDIDTATAPSGGRQPARGQPTAPDQRLAADDSMSPAERRLLATMPLHAITALHGETALRERFAIEIAGFPDAGRQRLEQALGLAARLHAADRRQREPYLNHLLRVATRIISHYHVRDTDVVCAALLHDAVEDHAADLAPGGGQQEALTVLAGLFGPRVAEFVGAVTTPAYEPGRDHHRPVPRACSRQPGNQPLGARHQDLRLHR